MSDDRMNLELGVDIHVSELDQIKTLRQDIRDLARDIKIAANPLSSIGRARSQISAEAARGGRTALDLDRQLYAELKQRWSFQRRMQAQQRKESADTAKQLSEQQSEQRRALSDQLNFSMRIARQRLRAEEDAERATRREIAETAKARDRANRKAISDARALERAQARAAERAVRGAGQVRSGAGRVAGTAAATGAVAGYGLERAIERGVSTRSDIDEVETQIRIFNDQDDGKGGRRRITAEDIQKLRRGPAGLDQLAISTGNSIADTLRAYNESSKAGLLDPLGQTRNILKAGSALELDPSKTTKLTGTLARNLGNKATPERMYRVLNAIGVGAREDPTQSNEIVEGLNRAQGVLSMSKGVSPEDLVAMVSGGQSVGIQPGKAGTAISALFSSVLAGGSKFADPKRRKELNWAAKKLGFGSGRGMAQQLASESGKAAYYQILSGLKGMPEQLRQQVASAISGNQWSDEDLQIVNGLDGQIKTDREIHDPRNASFIDEAAATKMQSWRMLWAQTQTIFSLFWESFGKGFDEVLREINGFFIDLNGKFRYDDVISSVKQALDGLKSGLGFDSWGDAIKSMFPSDIAGFGKKVGEFAKGFGSAIREIAGAVSAVARVFTGANAGPESVGRLAGQFISLGIACVALAPVMGVLGGLASIVLGLANMARAAAGVLGMGAGAAAGGLGGGAVAGALGAIARLLSGGFVIGLAATLGNMRGEISTLILDAVRPLVTAVWSGLRQAFSLEGLRSAGKGLLNELIPAPLQRWLDSGAPDQGTTGDSRWVDPPSRDAETPRKLTEAIKENTAALQGKAKVPTTSPPTAPGEKPTITYDEWRQQFVGLKGAALGRALEAQRDRSGGPVWGPQTGGQINKGLRGHIGRLRNGDGSGGGQNDGSPEQKTGGSRSWRNNNPGNIEFGGYAKSMGATSSDGRFARFPTYEAGRRAQEQLLFEGQNYRNLTLGQAIRRWAPASENNVPAYLAAMGGDDPSKKMHEYTPEQRGRLLDAMQRHEGWRVGTVTGNGGSTGGTPGAFAPGSNPADVAAQYLGKGEHNDRATVEGFVGHNIRGSANAWCARFVNASLEAVGQKGTGSAIANSYLRWGKAISAEMVQKGDVLVEHRGRGVDGMGGHVGFSTGRTRTGRNGELELEMLGGNTNDAVGTTWERASKLAVRRSTQVADQVAADQQRTRSLAGGALNPNLGGGSLTQRPISAETAPLSNRSAPTGRGAGGSGGNQVNAPITINGHNKSPQELASEVQRHLQDSMNRRTHDYDGFA